MNFVALDVETANADFSSICQIGVVIFEDGKPIETWETLVNPDVLFDAVNISIHGISSATVKHAPRFPEVYDRLSGHLSGKIVVHHMPFDKLAIARVKAKHGHAPIECHWLDTARVVRRTWTEYSSSGYGLKNMASVLGIDFRHHSAAEDARAAGEILVHAIRISGFSVEHWLERALSRSRDPSPTITRKGDPDGFLAGEVIVFTGSLSMTRDKAAAAAARAGCDVGASVTKNTTFLVVGGLNIGEREDHEKSSKHRKAEELIQKGQTIRILSEQDFMVLLEMD